METIEGLMETAVVSVALTGRAGTLTETTANDAATRTVMGIGARRNMTLVWSTKTRDMTAKNTTVTPGWSTMVTHAWNINDT
jgi:hypothetical protein